MPRHVSSSRIKKSVESLNNNIANMSVDKDISAMTGLAVKAISDKNNEMDYHVEPDMVLSNS